MKNIKTFEGFFDFFKKEDPVAPHTTHHWTDDEKEEILNMGFKFIDTGKSSFTRFGYFDFNGMFLTKIATGRSGREDWYYELIKNGKIIKEFQNLRELEKWMDR